LEELSDDDNDDDGGDGGDDSGDYNGDGGSYSDFDGLADILLEIMTD